MKRLLLLLPLAFACKTQEAPVSLKGLTADETAKDIKYSSFFDTKGGELRITHVLAYESSYYTARGTNAGKDHGTEAAYKLLKWVKGEGAQTLFRVQPTVETDEFPTDPAQTKIGALYRWSATFKGVPLDWPGKDAALPAAVDVKVRIVLGSSIIPARDGNRGAPPDAADACSQVSAQGYVMPTAFCNELAHAFVEADVASYNGHIWTDDDGRPATFTMAVPVNPTTLKLYQRMTDLRAAGRRRSKQTLIYMNACFAEKIEQKLMEGVLAPGTSEEYQPILLSHRNHSNFGYFAEHDAVLMIDLLNGRSLPKLMLDLTTTLRPQTLQKLEGEPLGSESTEEAKRILGEYIRKPGIKENLDNVIVVAYDVADGRVVKRDGAL